MSDKICFLCNCQQYPMCKCDDGNLCNHCVDSTFFDGTPDGFYFHKEMTSDPTTEPCTWCDTCSMYSGSCCHEAIDDVYLELKTIKIYSIARLSTNLSNWIPLSSRSLGDGAKNLLLVCLTKGRENLSMLNQSEQNEAKNKHCISAIYLVMLLYTYIWKRLTVSSGTTIDMLLF